MQIFVFLRQKTKLKRQANYNITTINLLSHLFFQLNSARTVYTVYTVYTLTYLGHTSMNTYIREPREGVRAYMCLCKG